MATPQQKAFCVLEFAKTNAIVTVQLALRTEFGVDPSHRESIRRWVRQFKETGRLSKWNRWRGFTVPLRTAHVSLHVEQVVSLRLRIPLSGVWQKDGNI